MGPFSVPNRHDDPGLVDKLVPGLGGDRQNFVVGFEDPIGKLILAHELPNVLDRVQFGRSWRHGHQGDVGRDRQLVRGVPTGLVEDEDGVGPGRHLEGDLVEMPLYGLGFAARQHKGGCLLLHRGAA
jgi:hypothetical protein